MGAAAGRIVDAQPAVRSAACMCIPTPANAPSNSPSAAHNKIVACIKAVFVLLTHLKAQQFSRRYLCLPVLI